LGLGGGLGLGLGLGGGLGLGLILRLFVGLGLRFSLFVGGVVVDEANEKKLSRSKNFLLPFLFSMVNL
jgi:hypothetical protein